MRGRRFVADRCPKEVVGRTYDLLIRSLVAQPGYKTAAQDPTPVADLP